MRGSQAIKPPPKVDSKAAREKLKQQLQDSELRSDKRQEQAEADQKTKEQAGERKAACDAARERLAKLEGKSRILQYAEDGSSERLTEEERQAAIAEARKQVEKHCAP